MGNRPSSQTYTRSDGPAWTQALPARHPPRYGSAPPRPQSMYQRAPAPTFAPRVPAHLSRSQMSLVGFDAALEAERHRQASRLSLHEIGFDARPILITDPKTLKKIEKQHRKMLKKMGARAPPAAFAPMPPPMLAGRPPPPGAVLQPMPAVPPSAAAAAAAAHFARTMSFDELHRRQFEVAPLPKEAWIIPKHQAAAAHHPRVDSTSTAARSSSGRGSLSPSPLSSGSPFAPSPSESHGTMDGWPDNRRSASSTATDRLKIAAAGRERAVPVQIIPSQRPTFSNHAQLSQQRSSPPILRERVHNVERVEKRMSSCTYTMPSTQDRNSRLTETGYSSCRSSVSGAPRADQSEIDFSWVRDEERRLQNDKPTIKESTTSLPEFYFGMEPPVIEKSVDRGNNNDNMRTKLAFFEKEAREAELERRKSMSHLNSAEMPTPGEPRVFLDHSSGPAERRIHRIARQQEAHALHEQLRQPDVQKWRSSLAF